MATDRPDYTLIVGIDPVTPDLADNTQAVSVASGGAASVVASRYVKTAAQVIGSGASAAITWQEATVDGIPLSLTLPTSQIDLPAGLFQLICNLHITGTGGFETDADIEFVGAVPAGYTTQIAEATVELEPGVIGSGDFVLVALINLAAAASVQVAVLNLTGASITITVSAAFRPFLGVIKLA